MRTSTNEKKSGRLFGRGQWTGCWFGCSPWLCFCQFRFTHSFDVPTFPIALSLKFWMLKVVLNSEPSIGLFCILSDLKTEPLALTYPLSFKPILHIIWSTVGIVCPVHYLSFRTFVSASVSRGWTYMFHAVSSGLPHIKPVLWWCMRWS